MLFKNLSCSIQCIKSFKYACNKNFNTQLGRGVVVGNRKTFVKKNVRPQGSYDKSSDALKEETTRQRMMRRHYDYLFFRNCI